MSVNIHGKEYITVAERVKEFRTKYVGYSMVDEIIDYSSETITIKTSILNENGAVVATGIAREERNESQINKTSYVENAETSAWGRALANLGIGIDSEVASANEVVNAIAQQNAFSEKQVFTQPKQENAFESKLEPIKAKSNYQAMLEFCKQMGTKPEDMIRKSNDLFKGKKINDLSSEQFEQLKKAISSDKLQEEDARYKDIDFNSIGDNNLPF